MNPLLEYNPETASARQTGRVEGDESVVVDPGHAPGYMLVLFPTGTAGSLPLLLPANLDLNRLCDEHSEGAHWPAKYRHRLAYVVHVIVRGLHRQHAEDEDDEARGVPLNVGVLRSLFGKGKRDFAKEAIETLEDDWGVIERTGNHRAGVTSRRYRLTAVYQHAPVAWQTLDAPKLWKKLRNRAARETEQAAAVDPAFAFVSQNLASVTLAESGRAEAVRTLQTLNDPRRQAAWLLSLRDLAEPAAQLSHSEKTGRIYHAVANCPKDLRRHLLIAGEPVAEIDIAASQFFLLLGLYPTDCDERRRFASIVTSGLLYEHLFKRLFERGHGAEFGDGSRPVPEIWQRPRESDQRDAFKKHALRKLLYERLYPSTSASGIWPAFAVEFPRLASIVAEHRRSRPAARAFCCAMQRREAGLILGHVVPRIRAELAGCLPVTVHDSILCQDHFASDVQRIVEQESARLLGVAARVKIKSGVPASSSAVAA